MWYTDSRLRTSSEPRHAADELLYLLPLTFGFCQMAGKQHFPFLMSGVERSQCRCIALVSKMRLLTHCDPKMQPGALNWKEPNDHYSFSILATAFVLIVGLCFLLCLPVGEKLRGVNGWFPGCCQCFLHSTGVDSIVSTYISFVRLKSLASLIWFPTAREKLCLTGRCPETSKVMSMTVTKLHLFMGYGPIESVVPTGQFSLIHWRT